MPCNLVPVRNSRGQIAPPGGSHVFNMLHSCHTVDVLPDDTQSSKL